MTFYDMTTELLKCFTAAEIAERLGCSVGAVKQARLDPSNPGHRSPPAGWETVLPQLAKEKSVELARLASRTP